MRSARALPPLLLLGLVLADGMARAQGITFLHTPPASAVAGEPLTLTGNVFGVGELSRARVYFRRPGARWSQVDLRAARGDQFEAVIPGKQVRPPAIEYYVVAFDLFGGRQEIFASESSPQQIAVEGEVPEEAPPPAPREKAPQPPEQASSGNAAPAGLEEVLALDGAEDVVSLATRHEQSVSDAPAMASSFSEEEMRQLGTRSVPDALKAMPGLDTSRDVQGFWRVAVRGIRSDPEVLVLYDGHALNSPYDGRPMLAIPTGTLERVEVVRGPGSALYGPGAFLGVVNLVPRRREELAGAVSAGSFNTYEGDATLGHRWGGLGLYGDASFLVSKGYRAPIASDVNSSALEAQGLKSTEDPAGFTDDHHLFAGGGAEARLDLGGGKLSLSGRMLHEDRGALVGLFDAVGPRSRLLWTTTLADLKYERRSTSGSVAARAFFDAQQADRTFQLTPADPRFVVGNVAAPTGLLEETRFTTRTVGVEANGEIALHPTNRLELGLGVAQLQLPDFAYRVNYRVASGGEVQRSPDLEDLPAASQLQSSPAVNHRLQAGVYAQDRWRPVSPLSLTVGLRADAIQLPSVSQAPGQPAGPAVIAGSHFVPSLAPRLGVVVTALPSLSFKALYGHAFRAPTIQELSDTTPQNDYSEGRDSGNPALQPVTIDTFELGAEQVLAMAEGKLRLRADGFWNRFSDPIFAVDQSGNDVPLQNRSPGLDVKGVEVEVRFEASARTGAMVNYSYFRAVDLAALAPAFELLTDVPQSRANAGLQLPLGSYLDLDLLAQLGVERRNNDLSKLQALFHYRIPAYALVMAQLRTEPLFGHFEVALSGYNVLQQAYQDEVPRPDRMPGLLPGPGFAGLLTLRARL